MATTARLSAGYHCPDCRVTVPAVSPAEAAFFAPVHDQVMHNGRVTALVGVAA